MTEHPKVLIHCQYLYGIGHFVRTIELARSISKNFNVLLVTGGEPIKNFEIPTDIVLVQLPAVFRDEVSAKLIPTDSNISLETCLEQRKAQLTMLIREWHPDIIITEHFPFGLLFEEEALTIIRLSRQANPRAMIVSSVRDVINSEAGSEHDLRTCYLLSQWFDLILIHGDPKAIPLQASFPLVDRITTKIIYTGYVVPDLVLHTPRSTSSSLLVGSIGGGRLGNELLSALCAAHLLLVEKWPHQLILFQGAFSRDTLNCPLPPSLKLLDFDRAIYHKTLIKSDGVICLGGYNSIAEAMSLGLPTLVYRRKFLGSNREQALRAEFLISTGLIEIVDEDDLTPQRLAHRIYLHFKKEIAMSLSIDFQGSKNSCELLLASWNAYQQKIDSK